MQVATEKRYPVVEWIGVVLATAMGSYCIKAPHWVGVGSGYSGARMVNRHGGVSGLIATALVLFWFFNDAGKSGDEKARVSS